ncbi:MAG: PA domain-containing protein [Actinomycetota bacterium]
MHRRMRTIVLVGSMAGLLSLPLAAAAEPPPEEVSTFDYTQNMHPMGHSARIPVGGRFNSDLAFWGKTAYQGTYEGFRIIDITERDNPVEVNNYAECAPGSTAGNQGDVIIWDDILVRSWNSNTGAAGSSCDGDFVPPGFEGLHVFEVSDPSDPDLIASVDLPQGSHTATGVPDLENDRLLVYNSASSGANPGIDIVEVPLDAPENAAFLRFEPSGDPTIGGGLPNLVTIDPPSSAAGVYGATGAAFGPAPTSGGISGDIELVNDGVSTPPAGTPTDGCEPFTLTAGAIALIDRGTCSFVQKASNAQAAGASAVIVANNVPGAPITMGGSDPTITIPSVMVSLDDGNTIKAGLPAHATITSHPMPQRSCHDTGVILGDALKAACAGGNGLTVWSMDPADGGSLTDPQILYSRAVEGVSIGHSASFTWDGETVIFGHEPGGGGQAQCQATSPEVNKTMFFFDADTGDEVGRWVLPRPQTNTENCTIHNYNIVPTAKRDVVVSGNYQSGISVVDFSDPENAVEVAYADPAPLVPTATGGDWSSYWYNGMIYESDITRGFTTWLLSDKVVAGAMKLGHLNPQTQEFTIG